MLKRVQHDAFFKKIRFKMHYGLKYTYSWRPTFIACYTRQVITLKKHYQHYLKILSD